MKTICFILFVLFAGTSYSQTQPPDSVFAKVEIESEFPGGAAGWSKFLQTHLSYPERAVRRKIQGEVVLQFIVDEKGNLSDLQALSGPRVLQDAALATLRQSPKWIPATQDGKKVKSYKKQPFVFRLEPEKK